MWVVAPWLHRSHNSPGRVSVLVIGSFLTLAMPMCVACPCLKEKYACMGRNFGPMADGFDSAHGQSPRDCRHGGCSSSWWLLLASERRRLPGEGAADDETHRRCSTVRQGVEDVEHTWLKVRRINFLSNAPEFLLISGTTKNRCQLVTQDPCVMTLRLNPSKVLAFSLPSRLDDV